MKKWKVFGRILADLRFSEEVETNIEKSAIKIALERTYAKHSITRHDAILDTINCERIKE